jgi:predicted DNA-binding protein (MmcQ/YjbR family)
MSRRARMDVDAVLAYALGKPGAWLDHPWDPDHDVAKVADKMFVMVGARDRGSSFAVRHTDAESCDEWRRRFPDELGPQPYMKNLPWSRVSLTGSGLDDDDLVELVEESYAAVVGRLPKKHRPEGWDAPPG